MNVIKECIKKSQTNTFMFICDHKRGEPLLKDYRLIYRRSVLGSKQRSDTTTEETESAGRGPDPTVGVGTNDALPPSHTLSGRRRSRVMHE